MKLLGLEKTQKSSPKSMGKMNKKREGKGEKLMDFPPLKLPGRILPNDTPCAILEPGRVKRGSFADPFLGERGAFGPEKTFVHAPSTGVK